MAQSQQPAPPAPPGTPVSPSVTGVDVGTGQPIAPPVSRRVLENKRSELSRQLESASGRREEVARDLLKATDVARPGLEARLKTLDARIIQLEQEIALNGQALANTPPGRNTETEAPEARYGPFSSGQLTAVTIVGTLSVLMPLALAAARAMMVRARQPRVTPEMLEAARRMERMEQALDTVAIEVERISEGQRFVTQLMAAKEKEGARLASGG